MRSPKRSPTYVQSAYPDTDNARSVASHASNDESVFRVMEIMACQRCGEAEKPANVRWEFNEREAGHIPIVSSTKHHFHVSAGSSDRITG
jgi:hypothetical protein